MNYGSEVWGLNQSTVLETVHLKFCKRLLGIKTQSQNNFVYVELGRTSLYYMRFVSVIRYWLKIVKMNNCKYVKCMYNVMCEELVRNPLCKNWAASICKL